MPASKRDPYVVLGVGRSVSDAELHAAYRRLVKQHHPDHNSGSAESARRFEEVQDAYSQVKELRAKLRPAGGQAGRGRPVDGQAARGQPANPDLEARLAKMERDLREARDAAREALLARERARQAARDAARTAASPSGRPSDEELGYIKTDDSFSKILADARAALSDRVEEAREHPVRERVADLIDELAAKLTGEPPARP
jgi:curved DNA-binding protein CbpA